MQEKEIVHFSNPAPGNKPICVGHQYFLIDMAPPGERSKNGSWLIPLSMQRVGLDEKRNEMGIQQILVNETEKKSRWSFINPKSNNIKNTKF